MKQFFFNEVGQGIVEYSLIILLVAFVVIGGIAVIGNNVTSFFTRTSVHFN